MENDENTQKQGVVLAVRETECGPLHLIYRLECLDGFRISVSLREECESVFAGSDPERAWELFCAVSRGGVTPCTLADVCDDYFAFIR